MNKKTVAIISGIVNFWYLPVYAVGELVLDEKNLIQNIAMKKLQQKLYQSQLEQFQLLSRNSTSPAVWTWDNATLTMKNLLSTTNTLEAQKQQAGDLDAYLAKYQSLDHYLNTPCLNGKGCSEAERQALFNQQKDSSLAQKKANDALFKGINQQQTALQADANQLNTLQAQAQGAKGQMEAIQSANQLASAQSNQLLQIRGLLVAQQTAEATRAAALADREAMQAAADKRFLSGTFTKSSPKSW